MGERRGACRVLVGKPEGNRPFLRPRRRWENNIKMDLQEVGCGGMDWINLTWNRDRWRALVNAEANEPWGSIKCGEVLDLLRLVRFSRRNLLRGFSYVKSYHSINLQVSTAVIALWFDTAFSCSWRA
jgi:hypothetical protein